MLRIRIVIAAFSLVLTVSTSSFADGDPANGEKVFRKCAVCHSLEAGKIKIGPPLHNLFGRRSGAIDGFRYSKAMASAGIVWTPESLNRYLAAPGKVVPGNRMPFPGLRKEHERADLIAYLNKKFGTR